ncbi:hypothetical protein LP419_10600 [Massilia sp. H-1]|nr:hypothetical protein LP419_10600 [Massilia sp. H-1]
MDGLRRVIRVGSFSKTLSPVLRVGSICASNSLIPELLRVKMLTGLTTSEINERAVYHALSARPYRRMVERLTDQLTSARQHHRTAGRSRADADRAAARAACSSAPAGTSRPRPNGTAR